MTNALSKLTTPGGHTDDLYDPKPAPLLRILFIAAIAAGVAIVETRCGIRVALITAVLTAVALATRLPRILPVTAAAALIIAALAVLVSGNPVPTHLPPHAPKPISAKQHHKAAPKKTLAGSNPTI